MPRGNLSHSWVLYHPINGEDGSGCQKHTGQYVQAEAVSRPQVNELCVLRKPLTRRQWLRFIKAIPHLSFAFSRSLLLPSWYSIPLSLYVNILNNFDHSHSHIQWAFDSKSKKSLVKYGEIIYTRSIRGAVLCIIDDVSGGLLFTFLASKSSWIPCELRTKHHQN